MAWLVGPSASEAHAKWTNEELRKKVASDAQLLITQQDQTEQFRQELIQVSGM